MGKQENSIFVGGISWKATEDDLKKCFGKYGEVVDVKIITDKLNNNQSKGFGFVEFKDEETCDKVKKEGFVHFLGKNMNVSSAVRGSKDKKPPQMHSFPIYYGQTGQQYYPQMMYQNQQFYPQQQFFPHMSQMFGTHQNFYQNQPNMMYYPQQYPPNQQFQQTIQSQDVSTNKEDQEPKDVKQIDVLKYQNYKPFTPSHK